MRKVVNTMQGILVLLAISSFILGFFNSWFFLAGLGFGGLAFVIELIEVGVIGKKKAVAGREGINEYAMQENRGRKVIPLEDYLKSRVVGQEQAIKDIVKVIKKNTKKQEVEGRAKPLLGTFLLVGLTGVGKTETAKALAEWFGSMYGHQFLQFDMGGFSDYNTASTLVGSPKGYIGSEEGGALTRPLMHNPRAVILFDEIEKAHPSLYKPLMRLIDEGTIQEVSTGQIARVSQGIILFTSNLWQGTIRELNRSVPDEVEREMIIRDVLSGKIESALRYVPERVLREDMQRFTGDKRFETMGFPPEFVGRIDKIVVYRLLKTMDLVELVARTMERLGIERDMKRAYQITKKYESVAQKYGVRVFLKKVEEELLG